MCQCLLVDLKRFRPAVAVRSLVSDEKLPPSDARWPVGIQRSITRKTKHGKRCEPHTDCGTNAACARAEICEHKGHGHPDSICVAVADAVSQAPCFAYQHAYGEIRHHNVDKSLLIGGQSTPRFGGGQFDTRIRLTFAGRADDLRAPVLNGNCQAG